MKLALDTDFFCWSVALAARWQTKATNDNTKNDPNTIISMLNHTFCFNHNIKQTQQADRPFLSHGMFLSFLPMPRLPIEIQICRVRHLLSFGKERALEQRHAHAQQ